MIYLNGKRVSIHKTRDWSDLPGYVSMRERPMRMKRSDWESLCGFLNPGRLNARIESRRDRWKLKVHWKLFMNQHRAPNRLAFRRFFRTEEL